MRVHEDDDGEDDDGEDGDDSEDGESEDDDNEDDCVDDTWVLKGSVIEKKHPSFLLMPNFHKLQEDSKNVSLKIGSKGPQKLGPFSPFS